MTGEKYKLIHDLAQVKCDFDSIADFIIRHTEELRKENDNLRASKTIDTALLSCNCKRYEKELARLKELVGCYEEYVSMLRDELNDVVPIAHNHGWRSGRYEQGQKIRAKIAEFKEKTNG